MRTLIYHVNLVDDGKVTEGSLLIEGTKISRRFPTLYTEEQARGILKATASEGSTEPDCCIDGEGCYLSSGFIELHSHGAGGADFMDGTEEAYLTACRTHLEHGTTTIYPTTLSSSKEETIRSIKAFQRVKEALNQEQMKKGRRQS